MGAPFLGSVFVAKPLSQKHRSTFSPLQGANPTPSLRWIRVKSWGGVPDHLKSSFARWIKQSDEETQTAAAEQGINLDSGPAAARAAIGLLDADTLCDRAAILGGDPDSCIKIIKQFEDIGVDQLTMLMQTETVPHEKVIKSLELFGKHVLPAFRTTEVAKTGAAPRACST